MGGKRRITVCDLAVCKSSRRTGLRLMAGAASETVCEGSVTRSPAFLPPGLAWPGLRSLRGRSRQPHTDRRSDRGMAQGRRLRKMLPPMRRRSPCRARRMTAPAGTVFPRPLRPSDAAVLQRIFSLQQRGDIANAARAAGSWRIRCCSVTLLADRYLSRYHQVNGFRVDGLVDAVSRSSRRRRNLFFTDNKTAKGRLPSARARHHCIKPISRGGNGAGGYRSAA